MEMMWGYGNMMGPDWGVFGLVGLIFWIIIFIDAVLLAVWLWQQTQRGGRR